MNMIRVALLVGAALLPCAGAASAQRAIPGGAVREGTLSFDGRATVGEFSGATTTVTGEMIGGDSLAQVRGWVEAPVLALKTGNNRRDRDLNKSMESEKYPAIRFELTGVEAQAGGGDSVPVTLLGRFVIHGVTRDASVPAHLLFLTEGVRVRAETPLNLKDYDIGGLTKMMGMLKMHEEILVHVDLLFGTTAAPGPQVLR